MSSERKGSVIAIYTIDREGGALAFAAAIIRQATLPKYL